jgi:hypothetical protein
MKIGDFRTSLGDPNPPQNIPEYLQALWYDARRDWFKAHMLVDSLEDKKAYWVHAYLHRKEGDLGNASYWYRRAGKELPADSLEKEWESILEALIT